MMKEPLNRYQSMAELRDDLLRAAGEAKVDIVTARYPGLAISGGQQALSGPQFTLTPAEAELKAKALEQSATEAFEQVRQLQKRNQQLAVGALAALIGISVFFLFFPGIRGDTAPYWNRSWWHWHMAKGREAVAKNELPSAIRHFRQAADLSEHFTQT